MDTPTGPRAIAPAAGLGRDLHRRPGPLRCPEHSPTVGRLVQHQGRRLWYPPDDQHRLALHRLHRLGQARRRVRRYLQQLFAPLRFDLLSRKCLVHRDQDSQADGARQSDALQPAPEAGTWFQAYFQTLVSAASPPL